MKFKKKKPDKPGWWWLDLMDDSDSIVVQIIEMSNINPNERLGVKFTCNAINFKYLNDNYFDGCMWAGPMRAPTTFAI